MPLKTCSKCKVEKPLADFSRRAASRDGLEFRCRPCNQAAKKAYRAAYPDRIRERNRRYQRSGDYYRRRRLSAYGITLEEYNTMLAAQGGGCAICGNPPGARSLHVDHDHATGEVRGLLCIGCNVALGGFRDDPELLARAIDYLG